VAGRIKSIEKSNDGNRTCGLLASSIVPQPATLPCTVCNNNMADIDLLDGSDTSVALYKVLKWCLIIDI
jgi:hypothetical protein